MIGRGKRRSARTTFGLMVVLCGVAEASSVSNAHPRSGNEAFPPAVCFEEAFLDVQMEIVGAQMDGEIEALNETIQTVESSRDTDDALLLQMQAQMEELEHTRQRAIALVKWSMELTLEADLAGCDAAQQPRIS